MNEKPTFGPLRRTFFPIYQHEIKKFVPITLIFFFVAFNYALLRGLKDTFVLTLKGGGAEAIAAAKFMGVIPAMILFKLAYDNLSNRVVRNARFVTVVGYFICFFALFLLVLYPYRASLEIVVITQKLSQLFILDKFSSVWLMLRYWPITLFYIHAEAWGTFVLSVLVWEFVLFITDMEQSKRFYSFLSIGSGIATCLAGGLLRSGTFLSIENLLQLVLLAGVLLLGTYVVFTRAIGQNPQAYQVAKKPKKKKVKLSIRDSLSTLFKSRYLVLIALLVLCYSLSISLFEAVYRDCLKSFAHNNQAIIRTWNGSQLFAIGIFQILLLPLAPPIMRAGWSFAASLMPRLMLVGSLFFFFFLFFGSYIFAALGLDHQHLAYCTVGLGLGIVVLLKSAKYIFFDATKERAYIPLDEATRTIGKSAVDGVGSRLGKGAGAFLIIIFITPLFGSVAAARPLLSMLIIGIVVAWNWAVKDLSVHFEGLKHKQQVQKSAPLANNKK